MSFIEWCNENQGFVTAVFSLMSLLISSVAIIISILTAKLPYKKSVRISAGSYLGVDERMEDQQGVYVNVLNVGNIPINIVEVGLLHAKQKYINTHTMSEAKGILKQMEFTEQLFPANGLKEKFKGKRGRVYAFARDAEGSVFKKFLCKANEL